LRRSWILQKYDKKWHCCIFAIKIVIFLPIYRGHFVKSVKNCVNLLIFLGFCDRLMKMGEV
jgi:hypothetical protein